MTYMNDDGSFKVFGSEVDPRDFLSVAATSNVEFHFGQSAEDIVLARLFHKMEEGFYVDVGAFHPTKYSNTFLLHRFLGWKGINIDASSDSISLFNKERPSDINVHVGVGKKPGELVLYKFDHPARNTLSKDNVERQTSKGDAKIVGEERVAVRPLADILKEHLPPGQSIDVMNVDIEGFDLQALESNDWKLFRPKVVLIEDYSLHQGGLDTSPIYKLLSKKGYRFISHTFDTSVYIEKSFKTPDTSPDHIPLKKRLRQAYHDDMNTAYRTALLADFYRSGTAQQKLEAKKEENKRNQQKLKELQESCNDLSKKIARAIDQTSYYEREYQRMINSKAWRYVLRAREATDKAKSIVKGRRR